MSERATDVELQVEDDQGDGSDIIAEATEQFYRQQFETLREAEQGEQEEAPEEQEQPEPERAPARNGRGKNPGIDTVLSSIEENQGKEAADVVRGIQDNYRRTRTEWKAAQREWQSALNELQEEVKSLRAGRSGQQAPQQQAPPRAIDRLTPMQRQMFEELAAEYGLVRQADLEQEENRKQTRSFVESEIQKGLEQFGDHFGYIDNDGVFVESADIADDIKEVHARLFDANRGVTAKDLYILSQYEKILQNQQRQVAVDTERQARQRQKTEAVRRVAATQRRSASGTSASPSIYRKGDRLDAVIGRAAAQAFREVP